MFIIATYIVLSLFRICLRITEKKVLAGLILYVSLNYGAKPCKIGFLQFFQKLNVLGQQQLRDKMFY